MNTKVNFEITGELYCINDNGNTVTITLIVNQKDVVRVQVPRRCCNPRKWTVKDFIKIVGTVNDYKSGCEGSELYNVSFSQAVLKRLFTAKDQNHKLDFAGDFSLVGKIERISRVDEEFFAIQLACTDEKVYTIYVDELSLGRIATYNTYRICGKVSIISYQRYEFEGAVSQINYFATSIEKL